MSQLASSSAKKSPPRASRSLRTRTIRCRKCGDRRELGLSPEWDRRTFVEIVCPKCSARSLLPTGRLILMQVLGALAFIASASYVIYAVTHPQP